MINTKKLGGGGDSKMEEMIDTAALLGIDLIEVVWTPKNRLPRYSIARIVGFQHPVVDKSSINVTDETIDSMWIDGTLFFYPDGNGVCWGAIYDTDYNRNLIKQSYADGYFRVVDKRLNDELKKEAEAENLPTSPAQITEVQIKKSKREREAEEHAKSLERRLQDYETKMKDLKKELEIAKGEKVAFVEKRLSGVKVPKREEIINEGKE